ncbi:MAG: hemerythrin family protein [Thermoanaerobaculia bacterium]|jgi:hemerythrin
MPLVDLDKIPQVPLDFINADHREEGRLLNELAEALDTLDAGRGTAAAVASCLAALRDHTATHFGREDDAMRRTGFPAFPVHHAEHVRVLAELDDEVRRFAETGDSARLRAWVLGDVPAWFVNHIETMDLVTARFIAGRLGSPPKSG